ncbi:MAG: 6-carboxytetrahydropterin synthase [Candidatus Omnitrophica bacterium]|nr:6-carboxytetrahydropterin synthase [Candidatus Omnitrophota bacterium]
MPVELTRRTHFAASHRLHSPHLSDEENRRIYGACNNPYGHGHNYYMEVTVEGDPDPSTGMIINLTELDDIIDNELVKRVDHHHFNYDVPFTKDVIPTVENLVVAFWSVLAPRLTRVRLKRIRLWESENNSAAYSGPPQTSQAADRE